MSAYIVRVVEGHELVGLYSAKSLKALRNLVDELCEPDDCEYAVLPDGGIHFSAGAASVPLAEWCQDAGDDDPYEPLFRLAHTSEEWALEEDRRWKRLESVS